MQITANSGKTGNIVSFYTANEPHFVKHERVEFLERLTQLDDPKLREIGLRGLAELKSGTPFSN